jgi:hypothetical protein
MTTGLTFTARCLFCADPPILEPVTEGVPADAGTYAAAILRCPSCGREFQISVYLRSAPTPNATRQKKHRHKKKAKASA